ncbi:YciK family oxidoreductase [Motiliproteus coralliicola]|uniref:YciK family oxidoreductase n=1 Tax=Motiliproteus coralliicola TaxID=2283196 RepID=A0A369WR13_9GAMM|nr:YciK family oxidoreductase [Motiliproteus coralliicola]RDE22996.1 YciK family oxidoreductase [Motiliproteus coralliicola]
MFDYQAQPKSLEGRVILISGAGDGIGRAAALSYAEHGATVILAGRTTKKLEAVYDEIEKQGGPQPAIIPINLDGAAPHDYDQLADTIAQEFGRLDGLLNNASILGARTPIENYDPSIWNQVMQINVNAQFYLTQAMLPLLMKSDDASVVFTSSGVGRKGRAYWGAYAVSKFATEGLMQTLADELEGISNIRVNAINPGATRTNMRAHAYPAENPNELPTPEQIMPAYLYLMGPDSKETNGKSLDAQG